MNRNFLFIFIIILGIISVPWIPGLNGDHSQQSYKFEDQRIPPPTNLIPKVSIPDRIPIAFIPNQGQFDKQARFQARTARYTLWITDKGLVFDSIRIQDKVNTSCLFPPQKESFPEGARGKKELEREVTRLLFPGADPHPKITPLGHSSQRVNCFRGNDPKKWRTGIQASNAVLYKNLYPHIDLKVYSRGGNIEYDWIVRPGGDPADIHFQYEGILDSRIDIEGNLLVTTLFGELIHKRPESFILPSNEQVSVKFMFIGSHTYCIRTSEYDMTKTLVIDPHILSSSTYFGGGDIDQAKDIAIDASGCIFITGETISTDFPTTVPGNLNPTQDNYDVFLCKFTPDASTLLFSTYLGGKDWDIGHDIAIDNSGNVYVSGTTTSSDFPIQNPLKGELLPIFYDICYPDGFITKFSNTGEMILYSTFFGGTSSDQIYGMTLDKADQIYITGTTFSKDFPIVNPATNIVIGPYEATFYIFVSKISAEGHAILYSTYIGARNYYQQGRKIAVDSSGNAYIAADFWGQGLGYPLVNPFQSELKGGAEGLFFKLSPQGNNILFMTYLGGSKDDRIQNVLIDKNGLPVICGWTDSSDFPVANTTMEYPKGQNAFLSQFSPTGDQLLYSTVIGGTNNDFAYGIGVDSRNNICLTGGTDSPDFPRVFSDQQHSGTIDAFITVISLVDDLIVFSSYIGGSKEDRGAALAVDPQDSIWITGWSNSQNFRTLNPYMISPPSLTDNIILANWKKSVTLSVEPLNDRAWLVNFCQAKISFSPSEIERSTAYRFSLFRRNGGGEYQLITHIFPAQITRTPWIFLDSKLVPNEKYTYRVVTYDSKERILDISNEVEI